jgi:hypothetical protein
MEKETETMAPKVPDRFQTDLLTLLKDGQASGDEFFEDYIEVYGSLAKQIGQLTAEQDVPGQLYRSFIQEWHRRIKVSKGEWRSALLPRALFSLNWSYPKIREVFTCSDSRIRLMGFRSLESQVGPFPVQNSKDCARNDLYLIDMLLNRLWTDPLKLYRPEEFRFHLGRCERCAKIYSVCANQVSVLKHERLRVVPPELEMLLRSDSPGLGRGMFSWYHRLTWFNKLAFRTCFVGSLLSTNRCWKLVSKRRAEFFDEHGPQWSGSRL